MPTAIHVSPHPDDESIAAPCTLLTLQAAGWRVVNFAVGLGRPREHSRRLAELRAALAVSGFEHRQPHTASGTIEISRRDDLGSASRWIAKELATLVAETGAELVVGPHARDLHHGHVAVARAIREAVWRSPMPLAWWMWSIWSDLPCPTLIVDCAPHLETSELMVKQYEGENDRNDYSAMHRPVRRVNAVRGVERALGFGEAPSKRVREIEYAELLTEVRVVRKHRLFGEYRRWQIGRPRVLDAVDDVEWSDLADHSVLSPTRFRPLFRPRLMSLFASGRVPGWARHFVPDPLPQHIQRFGMTQ